MEDECDIETLAAFLGESSDEECPEQFSSEDHQNGVSGTVSQSNHSGNGVLDQKSVMTPEDEECDAEALAAFLDESSDEEFREQSTGAVHKENISGSDVHDNSKKSDGCVKNQSTRTLKEIDENLFLPDEKSNLPPRNEFHKQEMPVKLKMETKESLFGEDSDSDWDDMDGDRPELSKEGREIKKLIHSGAKKREAHTSAWSDESSNRKIMVKKTPPLKKSIESNSSTKSSFSSNVTNNEKKVDTNSVQCSFSSISIINPTFSQTSFNSKMKDKRMIRMSRIHNRLNTTDLQGDWVTMGVIIFKSDTKQSSSGKTFCSWKLSDLEECDKEITFFLFGNVYKEHWKSTVGTVVGILNPEKMENAEKSKLGIAFTVKKPQQIMVMGTSKDLGRCESKTRNGEKCTNAINTKQGQYCTYHVQSAYKKSCSKRTELSNSYTGITPKSFEKKIFSNMGKNDSFFYGGQMFSNAARSNNSTNKKKVTLGKLQQVQSMQGKNKITTMSLHDILPEDKKKLESLQQDKKDNFMEMITTPTVGSMNLMKHILKNDTDKPDSQAEKKDAVVISVSAKDLIKEHKKQMMERREQHKSKSLEDPLSAVPKIGKNLQPGQNIFLDSSSVKNRAAVLSADYAKTAAIQKLKSKGGIQKTDPNAVKKSFKSPEQVDKIKKRVIGDTSPDSPVQSEPPMKRSRLLGDVDLNSDEVKKLLKASSKHNGALSKIASERQEKYFNELEKKEKYEEKLESIKEMDCTAYCCRQCKYLAYKIGDKCKAENHSTFSVKTKKRFFKCKHCSFRTTVLYNKYPSKSCSLCQIKRPKAPPAMSAWDYPSAQLAQRSCQKPPPQKPATLRKNKELT